ncbi:hypothetical protein [Nocardia vinacea]|uniref:hypothetical protein n=1 Tax=Nocardia vinacea TaxID=96468 RepID=UPI00068602DA|nr:hypothetical protein [Nocardia vinacea]
MGIHQSTPRTRPICRRTAALALASAVPLSVILISAAPATAESQPLGNPTPYGFVVEPSAPVDGNIAFAPLALRSAAALVADPDSAAPAPTDSVDAPQPDQSAQPSVAPVNRIRIGNLQVDRPDWLAPEQAAQINDASAGTGAALSQGIQSMGVDRARSDHMADVIIGDAIIGASVGSTVASPLAATSAIVGAGAGLIAGIPFLPAGLIVVPIIGAAIGYGVIAAPAAAAGAAVGAAVGAIDGAVSPIPPQEQLATA